MKLRKKSWLLISTQMLGKQLFLLFQPSMTQPTLRVESRDLHPRVVKIRSR